MKKLVLFLVCAACTRNEPPPPAKTASVAPPPPTVSVSAAPTTSAPSPVSNDPIAIAKRWNAALNASDMTALSALYADRVKYYGVTFDRAALVKKVSDILAKKPYHQDIKDVSSWHSKNGIRVQFHKFFGARVENGGYLILDEKTLLVTEESDMTTDDTLLLAGTCIPFGQTVTVTGDLSHAMGPPSDDFWVIGLDKRVCVRDEDGGRLACELPEALGAVPPNEATALSLTGNFGGPYRHQECSFYVASARAIRKTP